MGGDIVQRVPTPETQRQNLTQPAEKEPIPSIVGYFDGLSSLL
jgi:hypothetical protein